MNIGEHQLGNNVCKEVLHPPFLQGNWHERLERTEARPSLALYYYPIHYVYIISKQSLCTVTIVIYCPLCLLYNHHLYCPSRRLNGGCVEKGGQQNRLYEVSASKIPSTKFCEGFWDFVAVSSPTGSPFHELSTNSLGFYECPAPSTILE